jgi:Family of unknown function (DUF5994)
MTSPPLSPKIAMAVASPRLDLKLLTPPSGNVDGGWWPYSRELAIEAPDLARAAATRLGPVRRITYARATWKPAPHHVLVRVSGTAVQVVALAESASQDSDRVLVTGASDRSLTLLVVPPEANDRDGHDAMSTAAQPWRRDPGDTTYRLGSPRRGATRDPRAPRLPSVPTEPR